MPAQSTLAKALSVAIVTGSCVLKTPLLYNVAKAGKADGIALEGVMVDLAGYAAATSWGIAQGLPFSEYGDNLMIQVQLTLIVLLVGKFQRKLRRAAVVATLVSLATVALGAKMVPRKVHEALLASQMLLMISAFTPQILLNMRRQSTGQLALPSFILSFVGAAARLITIASNVPWEKGKATLLAQFTLSCALNATVMTQFYLYRASKGSASSPAAVADKADKPHRQ